MNNWTIETIPVHIDTDTGFGSWGEQDIALPGTSTVSPASYIVGDGTSDGGSMPLRMIIKPVNQATNTVNATNFFVGVTISEEDAQALENTYNFQSGTISNDNKYEPSNTVDNIGGLYPGWDNGEVNMREWLDGANTTINGLTSSDGGTISTTISLPAGLRKVIMYNYNFDTNNANEGGGVGNTVVVLAYFYPDFDLENYPTLLETDFIIPSGTIERRFQIPIDGVSYPIGYSESGEDTNSATSDNSWSLSISMAENADSNCMIIPYIPYNINYSNTNPIYDGYTRTVYWSQNTSYQANLNFEPTSIWTESSVALPENFQSSVLTPIFFWIIPRSGYVLSRHNLRMKTIDGTGSAVDYDYGTMGTFSMNSNFTGTGEGNNWLRGVDVIGPDVTQNNLSVLQDSSDYNLGMGDVFSSLLVQNTNFLEFLQNTGNEWDVDSGASYRGMTKNDNVLAYIGADEEIVNLGDLFVGDANVVDVELIDSKQYALGKPVLGQLISSAGPSQQLQQEYFSEDNGAEFQDLDDDGIIDMPEQYCTSDWEGNCVLVYFRNLASYVAGADPKNIRVLVEGKATEEDDEQCIDFQIDITGGDTD